MQNSIRTILSKIPKGMIFDSHYIITQLIKHHSDEYLRFAGQINTEDKRTLITHGKI